jgi:hypothetical protein
VEAGTSKDKHRMNYNPKLLVTLLRIAGTAAVVLGAVLPLPALADKGDAASSSAREAFRNGERVRLGGRSRRCRAIRCNPGPSTGPCACGSTMAMPAVSPTI